MALEGSLKDFGLADILQLIYFQRKTGVLTLEGKLDKVKLQFFDGNITGAESKRRLEDNRLGKVLLKKGYIKEDDLQSALEEHRRTGTKLGNVFINRGMVKKETVTEVLNSQISETVTQLFSWKQGTYEFSVHSIPQDKEFLFALDTQHLLMDGLRIVDEWSLIKGKITLDTLFSRTPASSSELTEEENEIFSYIDGENDVSTIIDLSSKDNFEVSKTLLSLMEKGIIQAFEPAPVVKEEAGLQAKKTATFLKYLPYLAVIISVIISLIVVWVSKGNDLKNFEASKKVDELRSKIEIYKLTHSLYPQHLELISALKDPWGNPYFYRVSDKSFYLASSGADGIEGTSDDIY